jgi:hypothetical protein
MKLNKLETNYDKATISANIGDYKLRYFLGKIGQEPSSNAVNQISIVLDNSGSMYECEEYLRILNKSDAECDDVNNDPDFQRISLMNSLIDSLSEKEIYYKTAAFTGDYCKLMDSSKDVEAVKQSLESIKTNCQNFNGTKVFSALEKAYNDINVSNFGIKYIILLTDGHDNSGSGWFSIADTISDSELKTINSNGVHIITVCLGTCDASELQHIATETSGKFLSASDASALTQLKDLILNDLKNENAPVDVGGLEDVLLKADSGFRSDIDGFPFSNFASTYSPEGNCLGFSLMANAIYDGTLPITAELVPEKNGDPSLIAYTLTDSNKDRLKKGKTFESKLSQIYDDAINKPVGFRTISDGKPIITDDYRQKLLDAGFIIEDVEADEPIPIGGLSDDPNNDKYSKYERAILNLSDNEDVTATYQDDYQILQLIDRYFKVQDIEDSERISANITMMLGSVDDTFIYVVSSELQSGSPVTIAMRSPTGGHSVLATRVFQDSKYEKYYISLYDSNYPGANPHATLERQVSKSSLNSFNSVYSFSYNNYYTAAYQEFDLE